MHVTPDGGPTRPVRVPGGAPRVALLSYRGNPRSGGQGVYVRRLSAALADLGADVEVLAGPPYPTIDPPVRLTRVPGLDLYREPDPFRRPQLAELRSPIDVLEYAVMCTAAFPEPLTFSLRVARLLAARTELPEVVHDNQGLGYGLLDVRRRGVPVVATVHHALAVDRALELAASPSAWRRATLRRWYAFTRMQGRVARRVDRLLSVSRTAAEGVERAWDLPPGGVCVVPIGVDPDVFRPLDGVERQPGRLLAILSSDVPLKGVQPLCEAVAKLRAEREVELVVVGSGGRLLDRTVERLGLGTAVRVERDVTTRRLVRLFAEAQVAVVPSLYEGFGLPAVEAMACGVPVVATTGGALPEVVGRDGAAGLLVPPDDPECLAQAVGGLLDDPARRARLGAGGRTRVAQRFTWRRAAQATLAQYERVGLRRTRPAC